MDDETRAAVKDALVREAIGLGALFAMLWIIGPGRTLIPMWVGRAKTLMGVGSDPFEGQVRMFARQVSEWDHEQAAQANRKAAGGGPCGCSGLPPVGNRADADHDAPGGHPVRQRDDRGGTGHLCAGWPGDSGGGGAGSWEGRAGRAAVESEAARLAGRDVSRHHLANRAT